MSDVVVTVPQSFQFGGLRGLKAWINEGDAAGDALVSPPLLWVFTTYGPRPQIEPGERVYIVCEGKLRGYSLLHEMRYYRGKVEFMRTGAATAVTIPTKVTGFRGWRYRWWEREEERLFPDWRTP